MSDSGDASNRRLPNILITGTPGVGKTTTASMIAERLDYAHLNVGEIAAQNRCYEGRDEILDTNILDEDKLLDALEATLAKRKSGGHVADFHACELFPERWFDLVLVLQTETQVLYDRLMARKYNDAKRQQNMECEIMQVVLEEAREAYAAEIVHAVPSNTIEDMESNVERVAAWTKQWILEHSNDIEGDDDDDEDNDDN